MATLSTEFKRLLARGIRWDAADNGLTFEQALKAACRARLSENQDGRILIGTAGNGASVTFALPQSDANLSPEAIVSAASGLYDSYTTCRADIIAAGTTSPSDDLILSEMLARLVIRRQSRDDFSLVRMR